MQTQALKTHNASQGAGAEQAQGAALHVPGAGAGAGSITEFLDNKDIKYMSESTGYTAKVGLRGHLWLKYLYQHKFKNKIIDLKNLT